MAEFNSEFTQNSTSSIIGYTALNGLLQITFTTATSSALAALAYGVAYLAGITAITAAMSCGAMVAATAIGAAILSIPLSPLTQPPTSNNWLLKLLRGISCIGASTLYPVTGAAILGLAIGPAALGGVLTANLVLALNITITISTLLFSLISCAIRGVQTPMNTPQQVTQTIIDFSKHLR